VSQDLFAAALASHRAGRLAEAERLYAQVLEREAGNVDALHLMGVAAAQSGRPEQAIGLFARAIALSPDFALARYNLGNALRALGRSGEAADAYRAAARLDPAHAPTFTNLGAALRALGEPAAAVDACHQALALAPAAPQAWHNLGVALSDLGRDAEAAAAFRQTLALTPDDADALFNLGRALRLLGRPEEALGPLRRAAAAGPPQAAAFAELGGALTDLGRHEAALEAFAKAAELAPGDAAARLGQGVVLLALGRHTAARAALEGAIALAPESAGARVTLAVTLQELGETADASAAAARAVELDPASPRGWLVLSDLKTFAPDDPDLAAMERALAAAKTENGRAELLFALGKALTDAGDPDRAFDRLGEANRLIRAGFAYDVAADERRFASIAAALTRERMEALAGAGDRSKLPIFVVGMPRSGTTLVEQILAAHPQVTGAGELPVFHAMAARASRGALAAWLKRARVADVAGIGRAYLAETAQLAAGRSRLVDKMPGNFEFAGLIALALPGARLVHCRRDAVDTCFSCFSRWFAGRQGFAYDQTELGRYWRAYDALMAHWRAVLPADRFIEISYEDLVTDPRRETEWLLAALGLDWDEACLRFHETRRLVRTASVNQVRRPIHRGGVGRWKPFAHRLGPLLAALGRDQKGYFAAVSRG